jgi:anti-sigma regulatory factor (Ser/Thr protein kinase)
MYDDGSSFEHEAGWGADECHVVKARAFVTECLTDHGMLPAIDDVRWVVSELATNAVVHAATAFTVNVSRLDGVLTLTVGDGSPVFPRKLRPGAELASSGRGLRIVEALSTAWGVTGKGTGKSVWATFDVRTSGLSPAAGAPA